MTEGGNGEQPPRHVPLDPRQDAPDPGGQRQDVWIEEGQVDPNLLPYHPDDGRGFGLPEKEDIGPDKRKNN